MPNKLSKNGTLSKTRKGMHTIRFMIMSWFNSGKTKKFGRRNMESQRTRKTRRM